MSAEPISQFGQSPMRVQKQIQLPFSKAWQISVRSIRIRLARSIITAGGIFLGIAFYSSVRASSLFPIGEGPEAIAEANRQTWLAVMALLVCFVGIMNSMLMSVTERFKEIGTMKCLGALDSFIVKLFFIEASLMGVVASIAGWFAGWLITVTIRLFTDGVRAFGPNFLTGSLIQMVTAVGIGTLITLVAAIPPASRVARMPPAAALRSEI
ncbi:MAG: FtsX-like permease family protein [Chloroherpetonaceae bacterium]|nr:FtsX-like permease family protein [Chthonomonadaceae bacterium]MDW8207498.1 FtsX-like permease family protein [Chloroherpetonaceae bacterium]